MTAETEWDERRPTGWQSQKPVGLITVFLLALLTIPAVLGCQYREEWAALQRFCLPACFRSQFLAGVSRAGSGSPYLLLYGVLWCALFHYLYKRTDAQDRRKLRWFVLLAVVAFVLPAHIILTTLGMPSLWPHGLAPP